MSEKQTIAGIRAARERDRRLEITRDDLLRGLPADPRLRWELEFDDGRPELKLHRRDRERYNSLVGMIYQNVARWIGYIKVDRQIAHLKQPHEDNRLKSAQHLHALAVELLDSEEGSKNETVEGRPETADKAGVEEAQE